jgi:acetoin utilization protein AcuC
VDAPGSDDRPATGPLLVFGPRSLTYDFGPGHPLTPRRFGPGIDLLAAVGARPGLAPEPASDRELRLVHTAEYIRAVRRFSADPSRLPERGIGPGDTPAFAGMDEAAASVAGGSLRAIEAVLDDRASHAYQPGGGLHHAMPDRGSGFCVYDDVGLAIAFARQRGARVLYVDLDVHHGDGVQAMHWDDPGVLTVSLHQSGRTIFPGTGFVDELGGETALGSAVNVPFEPWTGDDPWLEAVHRLVPQLAAAFGPDVVVSQHGADAHAFDPLGNLHITTRAMSEAARTVDRVAHRWADGRWLATGGGGYSVYRAVSRAWALTWLAGAHRAPPVVTPEEWRARWTDEALRFGDGPMPESFLDPPNAGIPESQLQDSSERRSRITVALVREVVLPALLREAETQGWWSAWPANEPGGSRAPRGSQEPGGAGEGRGAGEDRGSEASLRTSIDAQAWERLDLAPRVLPPFDARAGHALVARALAEPGRVRLSVAVWGGTVVGAALTVVEGDRERLIGLGVAPGHRRRGLATALLRSHLVDATGPIDVVITVGDRDPVEPLPRPVRGLVIRRVLEAVGFRPTPVPSALGAADPSAVVARWEPSP